MSLSCPVCHSLNLLPQQRKELHRSMVGDTAAVGADHFISLIDNEVEVRTETSMRQMGFARTILGKALLAQFAGIAPNCRTRSSLDHMVDARILGTYRCADCNYTFSS